jgi:hypothetical protein
VAIRSGTWLTVVLPCTHVTWIRLIIRPLAKNKSRSVLTFTDSSRSYDAGFAGCWEEFNMEMEYVSEV